MNIAIKTDKLTFHYPVSDEGAPKNILSDLDLEVEEGTFVAVIGRNGSGKSTLARHMNGILLPTGGSVTAFGMDTRDEEKLLDIRRSVGMVFQNPDNQIVSNVVEEDVAFAPENLGVPPEEIRTRVDEALNMVGMYDYHDRAPHLLSGGQKQRIAIAGVLAMKPKCIVFDEPTAMLDPVGRLEIMSIIDALRKENGTTVVLITHHMSEAAMADRIVVINEGRIAMDGTPREVFSRVGELDTLGMEVPATTQLLNELKSVGFDLGTQALSVEECADEIAAYIGK